MSIGPAEIIIVLILALLVFGPKRLPQMGKSLGKGVREFRKAADTAKEELGLGGVTDQINEVKSTFTEPIKEVTGTFGDLKSSVDLKSAIEAPVAAKGATAAGGVAAAGAALDGAPVTESPAPATAAQDVAAGVEGYEMPATSPSAAAGGQEASAADPTQAPAAPDAPESPAGDVAGGPSASPDVAAAASASPAAGA